MRGREAVRAMGRGGVPSTGRAAIAAALVGAGLVACSSSPPGPGAAGQPSADGGAPSSGGGEDVGSDGGGPATTCSSALGIGFASTPSSFSVPAARCKTPFDAPADALGADPVHFATFDLTGDQGADLVVFHDACDATVGATHWDVYARGASGFAAAPSALAVPASRCAASFDAEMDANASDPLTYSLLDVSGDGNPDLVVHRDKCDASVGATHWDVYPWSAAGFAAAPASFAIPAARCRTPFAAAGDMTTAAPLRYTLLDLTGDGHADLVVLHDDCDATVGATHWDVYPWSPSGFADAPVPFSLPAARCHQPFDTIAADLGGNAVSFAVLDLTGDARADLVVVRDQCDATVGATHWDVYPWSPSGFAAAPSPFAVPAARCNGPFDALAGAAPIGFALVGLTGGGPPSLVVHRDSCDATVGATHWDVYPWGASGFAASPLAFAVPAARCNSRFDALSATLPAPISCTVAGGSAPRCAAELFVFRDSCDGTVGQTHWDVYEGR